MLLYLGCRIYRISNIKTTIESSIYTQIFLSFSEKYKTKNVEITKIYNLRMTVSFDEKNKSDFTMLIF